MIRRIFIALIILVAMLFTYCSKEPAPLPDDPAPDHDTTRPDPGPGTGDGNGSGNGGNNGGINDSSGVTILRGIDGTTLFYHGFNNPTACVSSDEYGTTIDLQHADTGKIRTKLVNSHKGTIAMTSYTAWNGITHYSVAFSNINGEYFTNADIERPDTAGKLQIWVYRADGKDIIPARNGQSAVNRIIHMIGTLPANVAGEGTIGLTEFPHPQSRITATYMDSVFANGRWTIYRWNRRP